MDPYNLEGMTSTYLDSGPDAYDVLEVDTIMLGEIVDTGKLQQLDSIFAVNDDIYPPSAVESVKIDSKLYGVPTLQCASFMTELSDENNGPHPPILQDWTSFKEMEKYVDPAHANGTRLVGNFCGIVGHFPHSIWMHTLTSMVQRNSMKALIAIQLMIKS